MYRVVSASVNSSVPTLQSGCIENDVRVCKKNHYVYHYQNRLMKTATIYTLALSSGLGLTLLSSCFLNDNKASDESVKEALKMAEEMAVTEVSSDSLNCTLMVPAGMTETVSLDPTVPFQYQDQEKIRYLVGNCEPIEDVELAFLINGFGDDSKTVKENYLEFTKKMVTDAGATLSNESEIEPIVANGVKGVMIQADAANTEAILPLTYWIACFQTEKTVYKFIYWTMKSRKDKERPNALRMFKSIDFKEK